ncbi:MAG: SDR family NAD(P)-dependent oxidoreductase [Chitinophagaceae bacterium]
MTILITGASRGIGKALARQFGAQGYDLLLSSRSEVALYACVEEMMTHFPNINVWGRAFDLAEKDSCKQLAAWAIEKAGGPDIVVNNAGIFVPGAVHNEPEGALEQQIETNLYSAYHLTRAILPAMMERGKGHIFNICSIASLKAYPNGGAYGISKFALYGFSQNLREEMKPHGIKVTAVLPGAVLTDSWGGFDNRNHRIMEAEDVARLIYAASQLSPAACVEDIVLRPQLGDL